MKNLPFLQPIRRWFNDRPLRGKLMGCIALLLAAALAACLGGIAITRSTDDRLLYESVRGTMAYSANMIAENLESAQNMTGMLLADTNVQHYLVIANDQGADSLQRSKAYSYLSSTVTTYYQNFRGNGIRYITLYNDTYATRSDYSQSTVIPDDILEALKDAAHEGDGAPVWVTDYCDSAGLFLCRDIRSINRLSLETIGTLIVCIDMDNLLEISAAQYSSGSETQYVLYDEEGRPFYGEIRAASSENAAAGPVFPDAYGVSRLEGHNYFYIKDTLPSFGWQYLALIPYDAPIQAQRTALLLCTALILGISFAGLLFAFLMVGSITGHFTNLVTKMNAFGQDETTLPTSDYDYTDRQDEIGELHRQFDRMAVHVQELIQRNYVNELLAKDAQIKFLETQINPHFLYNTLESINWRAKALGDTDISRMVEALGALLRVTLGRKEVTSTIGTELEIVRNYMAIIEVRYDERIEFHNEVPEALYDVPLPRLTLQPLVENAINYALEEMTETCTIRITGSSDTAGIRLAITNNGSQFPEDLLERLESGALRPHGFGIGLTNIQQRLRLEYGPDYGLQFHNDELRDLAIVEVVLPPVTEDHLV